MLIIKKILTALMLLILFSSCKTENNNALIIQDGDIIFQKSNKPEHKVMNYISDGYFNHCGIIIKKNGIYQVLSAEKTVCYTELKLWIKNGDKKKYRIYRPKKIFRKKIGLILKNALLLKGKIYDYQFDWSDNKIYSSELIQKAFKKGANIYIGDFIKVTGAYNSTADSVGFHKYKKFIPYGKEVVTINALQHSSYLQPLMLKN